MTGLILLRTDAGAVTFGRLTIPGGSILYTLEPPWKGNAPKVSCIPDGTYPLKRRWSNSHGREVFGIEDVPDRTDIELHIGNFLKDTLGCVLLGLGRDHEAVIRSTEAFQRFMTAMEGVNETTIDIAWATNALPLAA